MPGGHEMNYTHDCRPSLVTFLLSLSRPHNAMSSDVAALYPTLTYFKRFSEKLPYMVELHRSDGRVSQAIIRVPLATQTDDIPVLFKKAMEDYVVAVTEGSEIPCAIVHIGNLWLPDVPGSRSRATGDPDARIKTVAAYDPAPDYARADAFLVRAGLDGITSDLTATVHVFTSPDGTPSEPFLTLLKGVRATFQSKEDVYTRQKEEEQDDEGSMVLYKRAEGACNDLVAEHTPQLAHMHKCAGRDCFCRK